MEKRDNIIRRKLKDKVGLPEIKTALSYAGYEMSIQDLVVRINQLESKV